MAEDVSKCVLFAQMNNLELAVKGGGHSTSGSSSTDGGLCIDLDKMRAVTIDVEKKTVTAQGGALWKDVDDNAAVHKLACVGGTVNHTGVGGLSLGGGYGWLTGEHGMVVDNMLSIEYVLADGSLTNRSIITASPSQNTDLFWAARGAGHGFGVATSFTYQAHDQPNEIWGGSIIFPKSELESVINFANASIALLGAKHMMSVGIAAPPPIGFPVILAGVSYNGSAEEALVFYAPLLALNIIMNTTASMPYPQINSILNASMDHSLRRTIKGSAFIPLISITQVETLFTDFETFRTEVPDAVATMILLEFVHFSKILEVKQTDTAFANRGRYGNVVFLPGWLDSQFYDACREWSREMARKCKEVFVQQVGEKDDGVGEYTNIDGLNSPAEVLFGVNYPRLKELKKVYDPKNVFCKGPNLLA